MPTATNVQFFQFYANWLRPSDSLTTGGGIEAEDSYNLVATLADDTVILNATTSARQYPVTGLTEGTQYKFKVCAINVAGRGPWSDINTQTTATRQQPGAPGLPTVTSTTSISVSINFTMPAQIGGSAITKFAVQYQKAGTSPWEASSNNVAGTDYTLTGLEPNQAYYIQVQAYNNDGAGDWSPSVNASTLPSVPGQVMRPAASQITPSTISVDWAVPGNSGGLPIRDYIVSVDEGCNGMFSTATRVTSTTTLLWTGVTPGVKYCFAVAAQNTEGAGRASQSSVQISTTGNAIVEQVSFTLRLNFNHLDWNTAHETTVKAGIATRLLVNEADVVVPRNVRPGSTIVDFIVTVANATASAQAGSDLHQDANAGTLNFGGIGVTAMSPLVQLVSTGPTITSIEPNIASVKGGATVTVWGTGFSQGSKCNLDGSEIATVYRTSTQLLCTIPSTAITQTASVICVSGGSNTVVLLRYDPNQLALDSMSPSSGNKVGGEAGGGAKLITVNHKLQQLLQHPALNRDYVMCAFGSVAYAVAPEESPLASGEIRCTPPAHTPGFVPAMLTVDGTVWLANTTYYTYLCDSEQYIHSRPDPDGPICKDCREESSRCNGSYHFYPKGGYWRNPGKVQLYYIIML